MATYLVEGGGSKHFEAIKGLLFSDPPTAHALLARCGDTVASLLAEQVRAGAQAAMLFDTWAGSARPADYAAFALPYVRRVFDRVPRSPPSLRACAAHLLRRRAAGWLLPAATPARRDRPRLAHGSLAGARRSSGPGSPSKATSIPRCCSGRRRSSRQRARRCSTRPRHRPCLQSRARHPAADAARSRAACWSRPSASPSSRRVGMTPDAFYGRRRPAAEVRPAGAPLHVLPHGGGVPRGFDAAAYRARLAEAAASADAPAVPLPASAVLRGALHVLRVHGRHHEEARGGRAAISTT